MGFSIIASRFNKNNHNKNWGGVLLLGVAGLGLDPVDSLLFSIGLVLESGPPLIWQNLLRLQLVSKNFERECPMLSFIKLFACVGLFGEQALIVKLSWGCVLFLGCQRKRGAFWLQHTLEGGTPNKHILGAWWKACLVSIVLA